jgi:hypothetical protein
VLHLGWFVSRGYSVHAWNQPWSGSIGADWALGERLIELARAMDQACFDYVLIEDGSFVPDAYRGSSEWHLRNAATVPKLDPLPKPSDRSQRPHGAEFRPRPALRARPPV